MKFGSSLLIGAFVFGCASLFAACDPQDQADADGSAESEQADSAPAAVQESEPNPTVELATEVPHDRSLVGTLAAGDEDTLRFSSESLTSASDFSVRATSGTIVVDVVKKPLRWTLSRLTSGESASVSTSMFPDGSAIVLSGSGQWTVERSAEPDEGRVGAGVDEACRFAPSDVESSLRWTSLEGARSVRICADGEGVLVLPDTWAGQVVHLAARSVGGAAATLRMTGTGDVPVALKVGANGEQSIQAVRLTETTPVELRVDADDPRTLELAFALESDVDVVDIEPNDLERSAVAVTQSEARFAGTIHPGEQTDWLEIPWGDKETRDFTLSLSRDVPASLRWQTVDGPREVANSDQTSSISVCALWREAGSRSLKIGVAIPQSETEAIGWTIRTTSPSAASFEHEPNEERLLPLEVPTIERTSPHGALALFTINGREPSGHVEGVLGNHGDASDVLPFRIVGAGDDQGTTEIELTLRPPGSSDLSLSLVDEDGAIVARGLTAGTGHQERIRVSLPNGIYHAVIEHVSGDACAGGYRVEVSSRTSGESVDAEPETESVSPEDPEESDSNADPEQEQAPPPLLRQDHD